MSLSREFAAFAAGLRFDDLPFEVVDRAKGVTLHALSSALLAQSMPESAEALALMREEEAGGGGVASVVGAREKLTRAGAAFVNAERIYAGGKWDTFRMLTHPGIAILPAALAIAEWKASSGKEFLTAIAAAYEVMERMASQFIPSVMARGFHASPVFGIFGAAVAAAKLEGLDTQGIHRAIAQAVSLASGNLEGLRSGGRILREAGAVRGALLATALARRGWPCGETALEGEAGFYHAYAGNNLGALSYSFTGKNHADLGEITQGLGREWLFLETLYRLYSTAGYNLAHVDVTARLCEEHDIRPQDIERIEAVVNWLEREYPSPAFPIPGSPPQRPEGPAVRGPGTAVDGRPRPGSTQYFAAWGAARRGYPVWRRADEADPPEVLELMPRVRLIPAHRHPLFAPRVTVFLKDGRSVTRQGSGREFVWDFAEEARRIRGVAPGLAIGDAQFARLVETCHHLDDTEKAAQRLFALTIPDRAGAALSAQQLTSPPPSSPPESKSDPES
jgi:MmgE/PrpD N-terminal domain